MKKRVISYVLSVVAVFAILFGIGFGATTTVEAATTSQKNIVARANYMWNSTWVCQKQITGWRGKYTFYKGNTYRLPYAWPVSAGAYIGYSVSVENFLKATKNASSVFYTSKSHLNNSAYSTYYGNDCSAFVSWCWGISRNTTYTIPNRSTYIGRATVNNCTYNLQLGDALNDYDSHVVLVTGLTYNSSGAITRIEITEQTPPQLKRSYYTPSALSSKYYSGYNIYRYKGTVPAAPGGSNSSSSSSSSSSGSSVPSVFETSGNLQKGSTGSQVKCVQYGLVGLGYLKGSVDGDYGSNTQAAVKKYQQAKGLTVDGVAGTKTRTKLKSEVVTLQQNLKKLGFYSGAIDGIYGPSTTTAVKNFQKKKGLTVDGIAGSKTLSKIKTVISDSSSSSNSSSSSSSSSNSSSGNAADLGTSFTAKITFDAAKKNLSIYEESGKNNVKLYDQTTSPAQQWKFEKQSDGTYKITNVKYKQCMTVAGGSSKDGTNVQLAADNGSSSQRWKLEAKGTGKYIFRPACASATTAVLDVCGGAKKAGTNIQIYSYNGTAAQEFSINKIAGDTTTEKTTESQKTEKETTSNTTTKMPTTKATNLSDKFIAKMIYPKGNKAVSIYEENGINNVKLYTKSTSPAQKWKFEKQSDGYYKITNMKYNQCLTVKGSSANSGTNIQLAKYDGSKGQRWTVFRVGDDSYVLQAACASKTVMTVSGGGTAVGTNVVSSTYAGNSSQTFSLTDILPTGTADLGASFTAKITYDAAKKNLSIYEESGKNNVKLYDQTTSPAQQWKFEKQSDGTYKITNVKYKQCMTVAGGSSKDGTNVQLAADNGSSSQRWKLVAKGTGKYIFYPACASASTAVLDVSGGAKKAGTNIQIYSYNGTAAQVFSINKISENTTTSQTPSNTTTLVGYDAYKGGRYGNSTGKVIYEGLDISSWQGGSFDFQNIKKAGYDYVILRCGTTKGKDTYFETNYKKAKAAGLDVGAYYYSYALNVSAAKSDAKNCLNWISGKKFEYPIYFDYEDPSQKSLSKTTAKNICLAFMDMVADKGYLVGMYTGHYKSTQIPTDEICAKYEFWVASYYNDGLHAPRDKSMAAISGMYQYTSSKRVNGVGPLDANVCYKDYPAIVKKYGFNGYTANIKK